MSKVSHAREGHGHAVFVRSCDDLLVALGTAWLNRGSCSSLRGGDQAVGKREEGVAADHAAGQGKAGLASLPHRNTAGVDSTHLAGANAKGPIACGVNNGV